MVTLPVIVPPFLPHQLPRSNSGKPWGKRRTPFQATALGHAERVPDLVSGLARPWRGYASILTPTYASHGPNRLGVPPLQRRQADHGVRPTVEKFSGLTKAHIMT